MQESNLTYPALRCQAVNDVHELDLKGPFYLKGSSQKYYLIVLRDFSAKAILRFLSSGYDWPKRNLQKVKGKVAFIRLVRKSGRITLNANDKHFIGKKYKWQYVQQL